MRIIFLDIDGVLNHACTHELFDGCIGVDQGNLEAFRKLVEESNKEEETKIVLSSSWRIGVDQYGKEIPNHYQYLTERLAFVGISIYSETPFYEEEDDGFRWEEKRGHEIMAWLEAHKELGIGSYVVLDDVLFTDFKELGISRYLVRTSWDSPRGGFTEKHIKKAMAILHLPMKTASFQVSANTLSMKDESVKNLKNGKVSKPVDPSSFK
ncbi:MAG: hypothetical protein K5879_08120 [Lachnospiraceae bacterium]|nr:hypothetical protein [Lachnospiraceae bacterium]